MHFLRVTSLIMNKLKFIPLPLRISYFKRAADLLFNPLGEKILFWHPAGYTPALSPPSRWQGQTGTVSMVDTLALFFSLFLFFYEIMSQAAVGWGLGTHI